MKTNIVINISPPIPAWNSVSQIMGQNAVGQSNCRILYNVISQKELSDEVYFWHADNLLKFSTSWWYYFGCA